jgi:hypothetical protein
MQISFKSSFTQTKFWLFYIACGLFFLLNSCGGGGGSSGSTPPNPSPTPTVTITPSPSPTPSSSPTPSPSPIPTTLPVPTNTNGYLTLYVTATPNNSVCSSPNQPCVSVTICSPSSPTSCVVVNNILLDTGSYGLRVFSSFLTSITLPLETNAGNTIAECVTYGDGSANWGPIAYANIQLTPGAIVNNLPIQTINSTFTGASNCNGVNNNATPAAFGFNGILGVGPLINDNGIYYQCTNSSCSRYSLATSLQVANPIAMLTNAEYNNGLTVKLPSVPSTGSSGVIGYAIFGIGTNSDNTVISGINEYPISLTNQYLPIAMNTAFNGNVLTGFLDTGSNGLFFNDTDISSCSGTNSSWYCPTSTLSLSASNQGAAGNYITTDFSVANATALFNTGNSAFVNLSAPIGNYPLFDYGLPFFFSKVVYTGFNGQVSSIGTGPYWGF